MQGSRLSPSRYGKTIFAPFFNGNRMPVKWTGRSLGLATVAPRNPGTATLTFLGSGVRWIGLKIPAGGTAQIILDGALS